MDSRRAEELLGKYIVGFTLNQSSSGGAFLRSFTFCCAFKGKEMELGLKSRLRIRLEFMKTNLEEL